MNVIIFTPLSILRTVCCSLVIEKCCDPDLLSRNLTNILIESVSGQNGNVFNNTIILLLRLFILQIYFGSTCPCKMSVHKSAS